MRIEERHVPSVRMPSGIVRPCRQRTAPNPFGTRADTLDGLDEMRAKSIAARERFNLPPEPVVYPPRCRKNRRS